MSPAYLNTYQPNPQYPSDSYKSYIRFTCTISSPTRLSICIGINTPDVVAWTATCTSYHRSPQHESHPGYAGEFTCVYAHGPTRIHDGRCARRFLHPTPLRETTLTQASPQQLNTHETAFTNKYLVAQTTCSNRHNTTPTNAASTRNRKPLNP